MVGKAKTFCVVPVLSAVNTEEIAWRYADRFNDSGCPTEDLAKEVRRGVGRALRQLRTDGLVEGPPWKRR